MVIDRCRGEREAKQGEDGELDRVYLIVRQHWVFKFHFSKFTFGTMLLKVLQKTLVKSKLVLRLLHNILHCSFSPSGFRDMSIKAAHKSMSFCIIYLIEPRKPSKVDTSSVSCTS